MISKNNVIDLSEARKDREEKVSKPVKSTIRGEALSQEVVDITQKRQEIISQERRTVKRTILTEFVGAFAVIPSKGLMKVAIYDISPDGVAFDIEGEEGSFKTGEEVALRVYLNQKTYFPFVTKIQNVRKIDDEGVYRHGGVFEKDSINDVALYHFVKFIETVSANLTSDKGDVMVSNLK